MMIEDHFGALRSALQQPPDERAWAKALTPIRALWHADPTRFEQEHLPYIEGCARGWPAGLRAVPLTWLVSGDHLASPAMRLFDALSSPMPLAWYLESHVPLIPPTREVLPPREVGTSRTRHEPRPLPTGIDDALGAAPHLELSHLSLHEPSSQRLLGALLDGPAARAISVKLGLRPDRRRPLEHLKRWPGLHALQALELSGGALTDAQVIDALPSGHDLRALDLHMNRLTDASVEAILTRGWPLDTLDLSANPLGARTPELLHDLAPTTLRTLGLSLPALSTQDALTLATAPLIPHLDQLLLHANVVTPEAATLLRCLPHPQHHIHIDGARRPDALTTVATLRACCHLLGLRAPSRARRDDLITTIRDALTHRTFETTP